MSVLLAVVGAIAAVTLVSRYNNQSALALGKVSAMVSATAVIADAWSKVQAIGKRLHDSPTSTSLPSFGATTTPSREVARREPEENDFYNENPSFLTGGIRGYNAYAPPRR